jgi:hypothetical protein
MMPPIRHRIRAGGPPPDAARHDALLHRPLRSDLCAGSEHDYRVLVPVDAVSAIEAWHISELAKIGVLTTGAADLRLALSSAASVGRSHAGPG